MEHYKEITILYTDLKGWYHYSDSDTVIVFVHGLFSNSVKCWKNDEKQVFWPDLIKDDLRFGEPSIFMAEFHTSISSGDYKVTDCSSEVFRAMCLKDEKFGHSVIEKTNIIFVGHSTGGIIARHILESHQDDFKDKNIGIALYASPSFGSSLASYLSVITGFMNNGLIKELRWGSDVLDDLDGRFRDLLDSNKLKIRGYEAYENKPPFFGMPKVVNKQSAGRYFSAPKNVPDTDHSSIVKPCSKTDTSHELLVLFFQNNASWFISEQKESENPRISLSQLYDNKVEDVLFEFYTPSNEKYYLEREIDKEIIQTITNNHLWLCGPTGVGKTVALQRAIWKSNSKFRYISLGSCVNESVDYMFNEILLELNPEFEVKEQSLSFYIKSIVDIIKRHCEHDSLILHIEEIPIQNQTMFDEFSKVIYSVLVKTRDISNLKLILSSIFEPADLAGTEFEKITERFKVIKSSSWSDVNISCLVAIIEDNLNVTHEGFFAKECFEGSPRKTKIFYRNSLAQNEMRA
ncbi:hypothetical protein L2748_22910 [Shewanella sairae]|uniref:hypothetical protein n=1 Tax=Shewanella sairae TaxID=190310 RepID=UPI001C80F888|nr:hypothetical protein [Shewanella sairae]MCL1132526.1 hypothetical protein [Shewanella sairae]